MIPPFIGLVGMSSLIPHFARSNVFNKERHQGALANQSECRGLVAAKHAMVAATTFQLLAKGAEIYTLEICECNELELISIPPKYHDLSDAFSENASNELLDHSSFDMKIDFKEGHES